MLCAVCVWMFQGTSAKGNHHDTYDDLVKAADLGCKICIYLQRLRDKCGADEAGEKLRPFTTYTFQMWGFGTTNVRYDIEIRSKASWLIDYMNNNVVLHISKPGSAPQWWSGYLQDIKRDLDAEPSNVRDDDFGTRHIPESTGDPEVLKLGLEWLDACQNHHSLCQAIKKNQHKDYFPKRLLDVGTLQSEHVRLIQTVLETPSQGQEYATLSHCWGKDPSFLRLTTENLPQLSTTITPQSLPQSFLDAVVSCRRLKIQYLWIDSLCILQSGHGAEEDWQTHVNEMDVIYSNCSLNIAIAHASSPEDGAFVERNASFMQTTFVCMPTKKMFLDLSHRRSHGVEVCRIVYATDTEEAESGVNIDSAMVSNSPDREIEACLVTIFAEFYDFSSFATRQALWKRGWVFQERLMAPRMLIFGSDRIYWHCQERNINEHLPYGLPGSGDMYDRHYVQPFTLPAVTQDHDPSAEDLLELHERWYLLVQFYSMRDLTYPEKDKLNAMAAIARHFGGLLPGSFCAGIFEVDLLHGLLWRALYDYKGYAELRQLDWSLTIIIDPDRTYNYQAPTWSWASVNDVIFTRNRREGWRHMAAIESISIDLKDPQNPFGQVVSADLTLSGNMMDLSGILENWTTMPPQKIWGSNGGRQWEEPFKLDSSDRKLHGLIIMEHVVAEYVGSTQRTHTHLSGLILEHVCSNRYQRKGIFEAKGRSDSRPFDEAVSGHTSVVII